MKKFTATVLVLFMVVMNGPASVYAAWSEQDELPNPGASSTNAFGSDVEIEGDYLMVSATKENNDRGAIFAYKRAGTSWVQQDGNSNCSGTNDCIQSTDIADGDSFGQSISVSGNYMITGAHQNDDSFNGAGSAYVFTTADGGETWTQQAKLLASDRAQFDYFGWAVSVSGDYAAVGVPYDDNAEGVDSGAVYFFKRDGTSWNPASSTPKIVPSALDAGDNFGYSVSMSGNYIAIGSPYDEISGSDTGAVYIYTTSDGDTWILDATIKGSSLGTDDDFGGSVALDGEYLGVGSPGYPIGDWDGAAYVFYSGGSWDDGDTDMQEMIEPSDMSAGNSWEFGISVDLDGSDLIVGSDWAQVGGTDTGAAYIYTRSGTVWSTDEEKVYETGGASGDQFGWSVGISGDYSVVGKTPWGLDGAAFVYYDQPAGGGVPEFSDYLLMLTVIIAVGLMVKTVPNITGAPAARA